MLNLSQHLIVDGDEDESKGSQTKMVLNSSFSSLIGSKTIFVCDPLDSSSSPSATFFPSSFVKGTSISKLSLRTTFFKPDNPKWAIIRIVQSEKSPSLLNRSTSARIFFIVIGTLGSWQPRLWYHLLRVNEISIDRNYRTLSHETLSHVNQGMKQNKIHIWFVYPVSSCDVQRLHTKARLSPSNSLGQDPSFLLQDSPTTMMHTRILIVLFLSVTTN